MQGDPYAKTFDTGAGTVVGSGRGCPRRFGGVDRKAKSVVYELSPGPPPVDPIAGASAKVLRANDHAKVRIKTTAPPGDALTIWVVAFDDAVTYCDPARPIMRANGEAVPGTICAGYPPTDVFRLTGGVVRDNGKATFTGEIGTVNHPTGVPDYRTLTAGDGVLDDVAGSEFHLVVRTHGQALPDFMPDQIEYFGGGCNAATNPFTNDGVPPDDGLPVGPNDCLNIQAALFGPAH